MVTEPSVETPASTAVDRDAGGKFVRGNRAALLHGRRARAALRPRVGPDIQAALDEAEAAILADLGGAQNVSRLALDLVARYAELTAVASGLITQVVESGPVTPRGRTRSVLQAYLSVADRQLALARILGLARRQSDAIDLSPSEWARQRAQQSTTTPEEPR
jgi:hypothetical protein